jgi:hypothetical protein
MILGLGCVCLSATATAQSNSPNKKYGFCMAQGVQSKPYLSTTFETSWPVIVSLESRFLNFIKSKYGVTASRPYCYTYATLADAQRYRPEIVRDEAAWIVTDWTPAATTQPAAPPPSKGTRRVFTRPGWGARAMACPRRSSSRRA